MGWKVLQGEGGYFRAFKPNAKNPTSVKAVCGWRDEKDCWLSIQQKVEYHKSWDWLMPVVYKIHTLTDIDKKPGYILELANISLSISRIDINDLYKSVVKFIKWYNKQKV